MSDQPDFFKNDSKSWLSQQQEDDSFLTQSHQLPSNATTTTNNFDKVLYKDLVEIFPLVESLMDRSANTGFTRRASLVFTKNPSPQGNAQSAPAKKRGDLSNGGGISRKKSTRDYSILTARTSTTDTDKESLHMLQEEVENLQKKLLEKDELLRSRESSLSQISSLQVKLDELKCQVAEKDSLIESVHLQLSDAKIKLADKQAATEKLQWEVSTSDRKIEQLRENLESMQEEMSTFMLVLEGLTTSDCPASSVDYDIIPYGLDHSDIDDVTEIELQQLEEAKQTYIAALAAAKESQDLELLGIAQGARLQLQHLFFKPKDESLT